ncbi:hypothetical protein ACP70R_002409 [Stipagrostis hirtigluma subsp. patula]
MISGSGARNTPFISCASTRFDLHRPQSTPPLSIPWRRNASPSMRLTTRTARSRWSTSPWTTAPTPATTRPTPARSTSPTTTAAAARRFLPGSAVAATIRAPAGDTAGLNYNLYLSSLEGSRDQDEIDFEFLGCDKRAVQTNYHVAGEGGREQIHPLPFDSSDGFHHYAISWGADAIEWRVDGELIRREERRDGEPWPEKPMFLYASVWDASHIAEGRWTGTYHGRDAPYVCSYRDVRVPIALSVEEDVEECQGADAAGDAPDDAADADTTDAAAVEEGNAGASED